MKNIVLYFNSKIPHQFLNELVFPSLIRYFTDNHIKHEIKTNVGIDSIKDSIVLVGSEVLLPETILKFKNNNNTLCSFDINDHTRLTHTYSNNEEAKLIDLIFKYSGIQTVRKINDIGIDNNLKYSIVPNNAFPPEEEDIYFHFVDSGKIVPMPHTPWNNYNFNGDIGFDQRKKKVLIRGAHHYLRYHLFLNLIRLDLLDLNSILCGNNYFEQYCPSCKDYRNKVGTFDYCSSKKVKCTNGTPWQDEILEDDFFNYTKHSWNNQCIPMFIWLADKFEKEKGYIDFDFLLKALNSNYVEEHMTYLTESLFYGDLKWAPSIYIPPRFWEAASVKTINFLPRFTNEQQHYGGLKDKEHYVTFDVDFTDLEQSMNISEEEYIHISENAYRVYLTMIKGTQYRISTNILKCITSKLEEL